MESEDEEGPKESRAADMENVVPLDTPAVKEMVEPRTMFEPATDPSAMPISKLSSGTDATSQVARVEEKPVEVTVIDATPGHLPMLDESTMIGSETQRGAHEGHLGITEATVPVKTSIATEGSHGSKTPSFQVVDLVHETASTKAIHTQDHYERGSPDTNKVERPLHANDAAFQVQELVDTAHKSTDKSNVSNYKAQRTDELVHKEAETGVVSSKAVDASVDVDDALPETVDATLDHIGESTGRDEIKGIAPMVTNAREKPESQKDMPLHVDLTDESATTISGKAKLTFKERPEVPEKEVVETSAVKPIHDPTVQLTTSPFAVIELATGPTDTINQNIQNIEDDNLPETSDVTVGQTTKPKPGDASDDIASKKAPSTQPKLIDSGHEASNDDNQIKATNVATTNRESGKAGPAPRNKDLVKAHSSKKKQLGEAVTGEGEPSSGLEPIVGQEANATVDRGISSSRRLKSTEESFPKPIVLNQESPDAERKHMTTSAMDVVVIDGIETPAAAATTNTLEAVSTAAAHFAVVEILSDSETKSAGGQAPFALTGADVFIEPSLGDTAGDESLPIKQLDDDDSLEDAEVAAIIRQASSITDLAIQEGKLTDVVKTNTSKQDPTTTTRVSTTKKTSQGDMTTPLAQLRVDIHENAHAGQDGTVTPKYSTKSETYSDYEDHDDNDDDDYGDEFGDAVGTNQSSTKKTTPSSSRKEPRGRGGAIESFQTVMHAMRHPARGNSKIAHIAAKMLQSTTSTTPRPTAKPSTAFPPETLRPHVEKLSKPRRKPVQRNDVVHATFDDAKNCRFYPKKTKASLAAMRNPACGYDFVNRNEDDDEGSAKGFLARMEAAEINRRKRIDTTRGEEEYNLRQNKKQCPKCGMTQSYAEFRDKKKRCTFCGVLFALPKAWGDFSHTFLTRMDEVAQQREAKAAKLLEEVIRLETQTGLVPKSKVQKRLEKSYLGLKTAATAQQATSSDPVTTSIALDIADLPFDDNPSFS
ncbi:Aste57867_15084 [Aphanomyces stellatus]|uniref:Aste57867_15084 protein n=1 Tax=Aphanomyces stellatus TaxID=120398 RepID=A0A485L2C3_9STRA|nr:hypothetical protein As57867_015028 [Aphanomyces stellatus]VFT91897.1 Aste57867_15084 [Aphanomyces stellatus]